MKSHKKLALLALAAAMLIPSCESTPTISLDPIAGICAVSKDGNYSVCWNPVTKGYTLKARVPGGIVRDLELDSATNTWRTTLPDGTAVIYGKAGLTFEPAASK